ncbi:MAG: hypothetical protein ACPLZD_04265 [Candidatus Saccharicenans sp.]
MEMRAKGEKFLELHDKIVNEKGKGGKDNSDKAKKGSSRKGKK